MTARPSLVERLDVVRSDEPRFWHCGGPLRLRLGRTGQRPDGGEEVLLGGDIMAGQQPQARVPRGTWQEAEPAGELPVLVSCVVAPGFDFADFRLLSPSPQGPANSRQQRRS
jgi:predicted cupin superfamily sugar epimerase